MSLSKRLRAQPKVVTEQVRHRVPKPFSMSSPGPAIAIINPTPDAEVDRLLALAGPARGVVVAVHDGTADGERPDRTRVQVTARPRLHGGALGAEAVLTVWVSWKVAALLEPGLEVPILLNRASGVIDAIATDQLARELAPRLDEAKRRRPLTPAAPTPGCRAPFSTPPSGPPRPGLGAPAGDVEWQQFVAVHAEINVRPQADGPDAAAARHGVAAGTWADLDAACTQRVMASPATAARFAADLDAAERTLRGH